MYEGSCCCSAVRFSIDRAPKLLAACHCSRCRKVGATPFAMVFADGFRLLSGRDRVIEYRPSPPFKFTRCFCGTCGTALGEITSTEAMFPIPANCFDRDLGLEILFHEHVATKPAWCVIADGAKQFPGDPR